MQVNRISIYRVISAILFAIAAILVFPPVYVFFTVTWPFFIATGLFFWVIDGIISNKTP